jgi:hypothetical protein
MPGGIVYGLRFVRSKFLIVVPRLPAAQSPETVAPEVVGEELTPASPSAEATVLASAPVQQPQGEHS